MTEADQTVLCLSIVLRMYLRLMADGDCWQHLLLALHVLLLLGTAAGLLTVVALQHQAQGARQPCPQLNRQYTGPGASQPSRTQRCHLPGHETCHLQLHVVHSSQGVIGLHVEAIYVMSHQQGVPHGKESALTV